MFGINLGGNLLSALHYFIRPNYISIVPIGISTSTSSYVLYELSKFQLFNVLLFK